MLEGTYLDIEITLTRYREGPVFSEVTKHMRDANIIPIDKYHANPMLDSRVYEVVYLDGHKASLDANIIAENIFSPVDKEGNIFVLFYEIVDHHVDAIEVT